MTITSIDYKINKFLREQYPIIAWDWDGTLTANGVTVVNESIEIMNRLTFDYGFKHIVVTGRTTPPAMQDWAFGVQDAMNSVIWNGLEGNPYKFKFYVLRKLWKSGRGVLRMYIDNDQNLLDTLRKDQSELPVSHVHNWSLEMLVQKIVLFKKLKLRSEPKTQNIKIPVDSGL